MYKAFDEDTLMNKIKAGEDLSEEELKYIIYEEVNYVDQIEGDRHRWTQEMDTIIQIGDKFYDIPWRQAIKELREDEFWEQPYEVERSEHMVPVVDWIPVRKD